jgi:hypothetical protein
LAGLRDSRGGGASPASLHLSAGTDGPPSSAMAFEFGWFNKKAPPANAQAQSEQ